MLHFKKFYFNFFLVFIVYSFISNTSWARGLSNFDGGCYMLVNPPTKNWREYFTDRAESNKSAIKRKFEDKEHNLRGEFERQMNEELTQFCIGLMDDSSDSIDSEKIEQRISEISEKYKSKLLIELEKFKLEEEQELAKEDERAEEEILKKEGE